MRLRDGSIHEREKLHVTPSERNVWHTIGGETAATIASDCGPIGIMICYDAEFPEVARHLANQGALLSFVPFCTDVREGYLRMDNLARARNADAVQNLKERRHDLYQLRWPPRT